MKDGWSVFHWSLTQAGRNQARPNNFFSFPLANLRSKHEKSLKAALIVPLFLPMNYIYLSTDEIYETEGGIATTTRMFWALRWLYLVEALRQGTISELLIRP